MMCIKKVYDGGAKQRFGEQFPPHGYDVQHVHRVPLEQSNRVSRPPRFGRRSDGYIVENDEFVSIAADASNIARHRTPAQRTEKVVQKLERQAIIGRFYERHWEQRYEVCALLIAIRVLHDHRSVQMMRISCTSVPLYIISLN